MRLNAVGYFCQNQQCAEQIIIQKAKVKSNVGEHKLPKNVKIGSGA
jgi:hypothetical protein